MANLLKAEILAFLCRVPDACARDVAEEFGLSLPAAGMRLLRLARAGLATRTFDSRHSCYFHAISPKGRARLQFFRGRTA
jgi:DNA-binding MarR family transcriptional regulator